MSCLENVWVSMAVACASLGLAQMSQETDAYMPCMLYSTSRQIIVTSLKEPPNWLGSARRKHGKRTSTVASLASPHPCTLPARRPSTSKTASCHNLAP